MRTWVVIAAIASAVAAAPARADAPPRQRYLAQQGDAGTVYVHVLSDDGRGCPDAGLLRRDVGTGEVVSITTCSDAVSFIDQCVPAGTYQYGLATPLACSHDVATMYYATVEVTQGAAQDCSRTIDPPVAATSVPWGEDPYVCHGSQPHWDVTGCGGGGTGGGVLGANLLIAAAGLFLWRRGRARRSTKTDEGTP